MRGMAYIVKQSKCTERRWFNLKVVVGGGGNKKNKPTVRGEGRGMYKKKRWKMENWNGLFFEYDTVNGRNEFG